MAGKIIWIVAKRYDLEIDDQPLMSDPMTVEIAYTDNSEDIRHTIRQVFSVIDEDFILRQHYIHDLRNPRGFLVPINGHLEENKGAMPYILEVARMYQHVTPSSPTVKLQTYNDVIRCKLADITSRIEALEAASPELNNRRLEHIKAEIGDLDQKIDFLKKRIREADSTQWKGMFKKNPMW